MAAGFAPCPYLEASIERLSDLPYDPDSIEKEAVQRSTKRLLDRASGLGKNLPSEVMVIASSLEDPGRLADLVLQGGAERPAATVGASEG